MEHWQVLNNPVESINVFVVPRTRLEIGFEKFGYLRKVNLEDKKISSALHKLAVIEEKTNSEFLLMSSMLDMKNDLKELAQYLITTHQLTIKQTLAYYRIMKE